MIRRHGVPRHRDRFLSTLIIGVVRPLLRFTRQLPHPKGRSLDPTLKSVLCVDAGEEGWRIIEYEELYSSASEFFGTDNVVKVTIVNRERYVRQVLQTLRSNSITHYIYDPRSGSDRYVKAIYQSICLAMLFQWFDVVPIARITDVPVRRWRLQVSIITAINGVCITLMHPTLVRPFFHHSRVVGPLHMPMSKTTLAKLAEIREQHGDERDRTDVVFTGSLYEPRITYLRRVEDILKTRGVPLKMVTRELGEPRDPNSRYWKRLIDAGVIITTADQLSGPGIDRIGAPHLLYRYTEVLSAGALLVAPAVPGISRCFRPNQDFLACDGPEDAANKIEEAVRDHSSRNAIARSGYRRIRQLVEMDFFWRSIDSALGTDGFNQVKSH